VFGALSKGVTPMLAGDARKMQPNEEVIFAEALSLRDPLERAAYLTKACAADESLRRRIEALLVAYRRGEFLESPADGIADLLQLPADGSLAGSRIGRYAVLELIGEGGMGDVYLAGRADGKRQAVALKVIKPGMDSRQVIARFELERATLAKMDHPHIAQFLDAGVTDQGRAYFVMELVQGLPLTDYCDRQRLQVSHRLKLLVDLCLAVQHAHAKGMVHRDLKPSNVLVTEVDGEPIVKVIDFGVAKALDQELSNRTMFTWASQVIGTPLYVSPEQARWSTDVDIRSDVYSLGVLLYELLSGSPPIEEGVLRQAGLEELRRIIQEEEPPRPSHRITSLATAEQAALAAARGVSPRQLRLQVRGDLDWIALKALAKDRDGRYGTPGELAEDLNRFLTHRLVHARAPRPWTRVRKWARRNSRSLRAIGALLTIVGVLAGGYWGRQLFQSARLTAEAAQQAANHQLYCNDVQWAWLRRSAGERSGALALLD